MSPVCVFGCVVLWDCASALPVNVTVSAQAAIEKLLTPARSVDVLAAIREKVKRKTGPYSIVFVGINGVGKSTTLAKVGRLQCQSTVYLPWQLLLSPHRCAT